MGKKVSYTCDYILGGPGGNEVCGMDAQYRVVTKLQNENTVFSVAERFSCHVEGHLGGVIVSQRPGTVDAVQEATAKDTGSKRVYPVEKWVVRGEEVEDVVE